MMLRPKEFALLLTFIKNEGRIISVDHIYRTVWGIPMDEKNATLRQHISSLRKKLEKSDFIISSEYGKGYCFYSAGNQGFGL